jgi:acyl-CoA thioester hydrolase
LLILATSVRYEIGLFAEDSDFASAQGHFFHVYVDRASLHGVPINEAMPMVLEQIRAA